MMKTAPTDPLERRFATIAVVGRPNSGKSTLINRLVGEKVSIVSDKPQTTRHRILGILSDEHRGQLVFIDTPGIHRPLHRLNRCMMGAARAALEDADLALLIVDASQKLGSGDRFVMETLRNLEKPLFVALNKLDLIRPSRLLPLMDEYGRGLHAEEIVPISALRGDGVEMLEGKLWDRAKPGEAMFPVEQHTDRSEVFRAAEIVREKILAHTKDEIPWTTAVRVDRSEIEGKLWRLFLTILVEKSSQRPILIGRAGSFLKAIGTEARAEIEKASGRKMFLSLQVEHEERWRDRPDQLAAMDIYESN